MRGIWIMVFVLTAGIMQAQTNVEPKFEKDGDRVKATYFYEDGSVFQQGHFKNKKLTGVWKKFDRKGNKISMGFYKDGKKVGKWFQWHNNILREITYKANIINDVNIWKEDTELASN